MNYSNNDDIWIAHKDHPEKGKVTDANKVTGIYKIVIMGATLFRGGERVYSTKEQVEKVIAKQKKKG